MQIINTASKWVWSTCNGTEKTSIHDLLSQWPFYYTQFGFPPNLIFIQGQNSSSIHIFSVFYNVNWNALCHEWDLNGEPEPTVMLPRSSTSRGDLYLSVV